jgi:hypothetical protein
MRSRLSVLPVLALFALGCGAEIKLNPNAKFPLPISNETPGFLFPINLAHLGSKGDPTLMGVTVTAGVIGKFGKQLVSGQQLFDLVGNLSFELAETIDSQAKAHTWTMTGAAEQVATALSNLMEQIIQKLVDLKLLDKPMKFKYIVALHSHGESAMGGKMLKVNSWGGIYDSETKEILSYINSINTMANDDKALLAQVPLVYNDIIGKLVSGGKKK